jgi:hypothetical protein
MLKRNKPLNSLLLATRRNHRMMIFLDKCPVMV